MLAELSLCCVDNILLHWLGHATCLVEVGAVRLVTDPVFSYRCSPSQRFGPARYRPAPCQAEELPPVDICLISHAHYDHLDMPSLAAMARWHDCHFYVPLGLKDSMLRVTGRERVTEMNWWETVVHSGGEGEDGSVEVTALPAQHWSRRGVFDTNTTLWCGYAVECKQTMRRVCFVGDTGYCPAFKDVGEAFGPFDLSLIPIGAYEPNWFMKAQHVNPEEAYEIHKDLRSQRSLGIHHGTFRLTTEPVEEPKERFAKIRELNGSTETELFTLDAGGHVELHKQA